MSRSKPKPTTDIITRQIIEAVVAVLAQETGHDAQTIRTGRNAEGQRTGLFGTGIRPLAMWLAARCGEAAGRTQEQLAHGLHVTRGAFSASIDALRKRRDADPLFAEHTDRLLFDVETALRRHPVVDPIGEALVAAGEEFGVPDGALFMSVTSYDIRQARVAAAWAAYAAGAGTSADIGIRLNRSATWIRRMISNGTHKRAQDPDFQARTDRIRDRVRAVLNGDDSLEPETD